MNEEARRELRDDLIHVKSAQTRRYEEAARRPDTSAFESYGKLRKHLEKTMAAVKPLVKTLEEYWKAVCAGDEDMQGAYLNELTTEIDAALTEMVCFAADGNIAIWSMGPCMDRGSGQMNFDEYDPEIDDDTGEILYPEDDLPAAGEVAGYEE